MTLRSFIQNRSLQEQFLSSSTSAEVKSKVYEVLHFAEETMNRLNTCPTEDDQVMQDFSLRCLFFLLNQIAEVRMKQADVVEESEREEAITKVKEDFELIARFCDNPDQLNSYLFKCDADRVFELISMAAVSFTGGNPGIERVEESAEQRRMICFDIVMQGLHYHSKL
ncbi:MAG: hypothetical protein NE328_14475 [Lentisphaeraceae bacterium]|nr:hypothetical protein [Lentisphaeraceae bacterium]